MSELFVYIIFKFYMLASNKYSTEGSYQQTFFGFCGTMSISVDVSDTCDHLLCSMLAGLSILSKEKISKESCIYHLSLAQMCRPLANLYNDHAFWCNLCTSLSIRTPACMFQLPFSTWGLWPSGRTLLVSILKHGNSCKFTGCCSLLQR